MRYYPLDKNPAFYIEQVNEWDKYQTCLDLADTIKRRKANICGTDLCATFFHPEIQKTAPKGKKKKKKKKKEMFIRQKIYDPPAQRVIRYWNDINGKKIDPVKEEHLHWTDWTTTRLADQYLPCLIRPTYIKLLQGVPPPLPWGLIPISLADVREIKRQDKIAEKIAKKLAKEKKAADKEAKLLAKLKAGNKKP